MRRTGRQIKIENGTLNLINGLHINIFRKHIPSSLSLLALFTCLSLFFFFDSVNFAQETQKDGKTTPLSPLSSTAAASQEITAIEKLKDDKGFHIKIHATLPVKYEVKILKNPFRIVLDVEGKLSIKDTSLELKEGVLQSVRFAQFSTNPPVARFVIDCDRDVYYRVSPEDDGKTLAVHFSHQIYAILWEKAEDTVSVTLISSGPVHFESHELLQPPRIAVDLTSAFLALPQPEYDVNLNTLQKIRASQFQFEPDTVRLVFDFSQKNSYTITTSQDGTQLFLKFFTGPHFSSKGIKIMVDAGHGGKDRGTKSPGGMIEKVLNLDMAKKLNALLNAAGIETEMMREDDNTLELYSRPKRANTDMVHLFVSIHCNSLPSKPDIHGSEVYYYNSAESRELAQDVLSALSMQAGTPARYVKSSNFVVVKYTAMPSILVEVGYLTNPTDETLFNDENFRKNAALGIFNGIQTFLSKHTKEELETIYTNALLTKQKMLDEKLLPPATGTPQP